MLQDISWFQWVFGILFIPLLFSLGVMIPVGFVGLIVELFHGDGSLVPRIGGVKETLTCEYCDAEKFFSGEICSECGAGAKSE